MNVKILIMIFTVFVCTLFVLSNPVLCKDLGEAQFSEGEVFTPQNGSYDFGTFTLNDSDVGNFTVKHAESGHVLLVDETGDKVINVIQYDKMINYKKDSSKQFIDSQLLKTGWMVDGVDVHEIEFSSGECLYSACRKDTSTGTMIYLATPSDSETAAMINSLRFDG